MMSLIDEVLEADGQFAENFRLETLSPTPARKLAVVACMDCRLTVEQILGLQTGDAHIIRNAGGLVTEDALRSLIISHHMLGTEAFMIINHTDCGMMSFRDEDLRAKLQRMTGEAAPIHFHSFTDLEENVRRQIAIIDSHPWIPETVPVRGFIYDVMTGRLHEVSAAPAISSGGQADTGAPHAPQAVLPALPPLPPLPPASLDCAFSAERIK